MENNMNADREVRLTNQQYIQQRMFNLNPRYANCLSWVYAATGFLEMKQMTQNISISVQRGVKSTREDGGTESVSILVHTPPQCDQCSLQLGLSVRNNCRLLKLTRVEL